MRGPTSRRAFWQRTGFTALLTASSLLPGAAAQEQPFPDDPKKRDHDLNEDPRLPDGKSQKNAIAKEQHEQALKDANELIEAAGQLKDEIQHAGNYVVPIAAVKKTEEIEKIAKRIRGRLRY